MKILKSFAVLAGFALVTFNASAQQAPAQTQAANRPTPELIAQKQTDRVKQNVTGITPDQEKQILAAELEYTKSIQSAWSTSNGDKTAMHSKIVPIRDARDAKLKTILTADQYAQYQKTLPPSSRK